MDHFFKTQPNPTKNFWTQPNPTHHRHFGMAYLVGYTENFIQQLLHVTDKFTVNEGYYSAAVLINRQ